MGKAMVLEVELITQHGDVGRRRPDRHPLARLAVVVNVADRQRNGFGNLVESDDSGGEFRAAEVQGVVFELHAQGLAPIVDLDHDVFIGAGHPDRPGMAGQIHGHGMVPPKALCTTSCVRSNTDKRMLRHQSPRGKEQSKWLI